MLSAAIVSVQCKVSGVHSLFVKHRVGLWRDASLAVLSTQSLYAAVCGVVSMASEVPFACIFLLCNAIQMQAD